MYNRHAGTLKLTRVIGVRLERQRSTRLQKNGDDDMNVNASKKFCITLNFYPQRRKGGMIDD